MGFLDLLTALFMLLFHLGLVGGRPLFSFLIYLVAKGILFWGDTASLLDMIIAFYILIMFVLPLWIFTIIAIFYLTQKGLLSMFM